MSANRDLLHRRTTLSPREFPLGQRILSGQDCTRQVRTEILRERKKEETERETSSVSPIIVRDHLQGRRDVKFLFHAVTR